MNLIALGVFIYSIIGFVIVFAQDRTTNWED